jgi:hypothetical protein
MGYFISLTPFPITLWVIPPSHINIHSSHSLLPINIHLHPFNPNKHLHTLSILSTQTNTFQHPFNPNKHPFNMSKRGRDESGLAGTDREGTKARVEERKDDAELKTLEELQAKWKRLVCFATKPSPSFAPLRLCAYPGSYSESESDGEPDSDSDADSDGEVDAPFNTSANLHHCIAYAHAALRLLANDETFSASAAQNFFDGMKLFILDPSITTEIAPFVATCLAEWTSVPMTSDRSGPLVRFLFAVVRSLGSKAKSTAFHPSENKQAENDLAYIVTTLVDSGFLLKLVDALCVPCSCSPVQQKFIRANNQSRHANTYSKCIHWYIAAFRQSQTALPETPTRHDIHS